MFFAGVGMPRPMQPLRGIGGRDRAGQVAAMLTGLTDWFRSDRPDAVVVQGDTNSANAGAQAAHHLGIPVVHVEAGLRSHDRAMPEEINRLVIGAVADVHCAATAGNAEHLLRAGAPAAAVHVTGNTIVEATRLALPHAPLRARCRPPTACVPGSTCWPPCTGRRTPTTPPACRRCCTPSAASPACAAAPCTPARVRRWPPRAAVVPSSVRCTAPVDHPTFLALAAGARMLVSDSGGVQEEVTVLGKPLVVVRTSTERPSPSTPASRCWPGRTASRPPPRTCCAPLARAAHPAAQPVRRRPRRAADRRAGAGGGAGPGRGLTPVLALAGSSARLGLALGVSECQSGRTGEVPARGPQERPLRRCRPSRAPPAEQRATHGGHHHMAKMIAFDEEARRGSSGA